MQLDSKQSTASFFPAPRPVSAALYRFCPMPPTARDNIIITPSLPSYELRASSQNPLFTASRANRRWEPRSSRHSPKLRRISTSGIPVLSAFSLRAWSEPSTPSAVIHGPLPARSWPFPARPAEITARGVTSRCPHRRHGAAQA
ncbi:hypothetical protein CSOJ01_08459 [Colletotrichum sojae]|uniref:Uncharacterized protein n=1 Tax=Colletotrichum sojae TaxID=2175907 RepID=A0A8H6J6Q6_9PEZI|nr:hypothetical protein CSOJ01_08459 [Colletotrichum sojae]